MTADMGNSQSPSSGDVSQRNPADSGGTSGKRAVMETDRLNAGTPGVNGDAAASKETAPMSKCDIAKRAAVVIVLLAVVIYVTIDSFTTKHVLDALESFLSWVKDAGAIGPVVFAAVYFAGTILFFPGSVLTIGSGFAFSQAFGQGWGIVAGSLVVMVGATSGAAAAFLLGRYALRSLVADKAAKYRILAAIDRALQGQGFKMVVLLRLSPVIPFNAFNYFMGLTGVGFVPYVLGSIGMIPGTVFFVYLGSLLSDVKNAISGDSSDESPAVKWTIFAVGIVATVVAIVLVSIYARRELSKHLDVESAKAVSPAVGSADASHAAGGNKQGAGTASAVDAV